MTKVKICGLTSEKDIEILNKHLPDYAGFVFTKSKRQISPYTAEKLIGKLDSKIIPVGVFVNEDVLSLCMTATYCNLKAVQLHGAEDNEYILKLRKLLLPEVKIIKALKIKDGNELNTAKNIPCAMLLLDTYKEGFEGGSGEVFDWNIIKDFNMPYILAGGLNPENVKSAISLLNPFGVDVSSGVETDTVKDEKKIAKFIDIARCNPNE